MIALNNTTAKQNFDECCNRIVNDFETIIITRECGENVVIMSESEYNNMLENLYVRSNPNDYKELLLSIEQLKKGQGKKRELSETL